MNETIREQIELYTPAFIAEFTITDNDNNTIVTGQNVTQYLKYTYGDYKTRAALLVLWQTYTEIHGADFLKAWVAWNAEYNPIDNYNGTETNVFLTNDGEETETITHGKTTTTTANNVTNTAYSTTFESNAEKETDKNVQSGSTTAADTGTTVTAKDRSAKTLTVGDTTYSADEVHAEMKNRHGNLGITTTQQMITAEIDMRLNPLIKMYIDTFVTDYAYYVSDMWGDYE